ncbi:hypothetical protein NKR23_g11565 [Pleurostoma richardsiae]|uniref:Uncharacterized protein n=1 Tax=Pleurostoma richardsiae TaxID=41990 RepID=A0AA38R3E5_9PEZI|nr:hypothetical protein NKR23_g11565 [Pleurostoma richardsiae]
MALKADDRASINSHASLISTISKQVAGRRRNRRFPTLALLSLIILFLSAGSGVALSVLIVRFKLETTNDFPSRVLLFVASCMSLLYVLLHFFAARRTYTRREHGAPWIYGEQVCGLALLLARLTIPVWIASVVTTAIVSRKVGLDTSRRLQENVPWLTLLVSVLALLSSCAIQFAIETSDRPFATLGVSRHSFAHGREPLSPDVLVGPGFRLEGESVGEEKEKAIEGRKSTRLSRITEESGESTGVIPTPDIFTSFKNEGTGQNGKVTLASLKDLEQRARARAHVRGRSQPLPTRMSSMFPPVPPPTIIRRWSALPSPKLPWDTRARRESIRDLPGRDTPAEEDDKRSLITKRGSSASTASSIAAPSRRATVEVRASDLEFARWSMYGVAMTDSTFIFVPKPTVEPRNASPPPPGERGTGLGHARKRSGSAARARVTTNFSRPRTAPTAAAGRELSGKTRPLTSKAGAEVGRGDNDGPPGEELAQLEVLSAEMRILGRFPRPPGGRE